MLAAHQGGAPGVLPPARHQLRGAAAAWQGGLCARGALQEGQQHELLPGRQRARLCGVLTAACTSSLSVPGQTVRLGSDNAGSAVRLALRQPACACFGLGCFRQCCLDVRKQLPAGAGAALTPLCFGDI